MGHEAIASGLRHCHWFRSLDRDQLDTLATLTTGKFVPKGSWLFFAGDSGLGLFIMRAGSVKLSRVSCEGKEQVLHIFRPGELFGEEALVSEEGYPADACAVEDSVVLVVQKAGLLELLGRRPEFSLCLLSAAAQHASDLINLVTDLRLLDVRTRLIKWLITDCQQHGAQRDGQGHYRVELRMTKRLLAAELGTSSETLSRSLAKLRGQGLLEVHGQHIVLRSLVKLERLAAGDAEPFPVSQAGQNGWHVQIPDRAVAA